MIATDMSAIRDILVASRIDAEARGGAGDDRPPSACIIGYLPGCYPSVATYRSAIEHIAGSGIRIMEIGIPGAIGDLEGGVIAQALKTMPTEPEDLKRIIVQSVAIVRDAGIVPVVMAFRDTVYDVVGIEEFVNETAEAGAKLLLVPDATPEEYEDLRARCAISGIHTVPFVAATGPVPTVEPDAPFLYLQTADMPTGGDFVPTGELKQRLSSVKEHNRNVPVALGFGIRSGEDVRQALAIGADMAIVGTAMVAAINQGPVELKRYAASLTGGKRSGRMEGGKE